MLTFEKTRQFLRTFIAVRDPIEILARSSMQMRVNNGLKKDGKKPSNEIQQADIEVLQALILMQTGPLRRAPTSPGNFVRLWSNLSLNDFAFGNKQQIPQSVPKEREYVIRRTRVQTVYYRNIFAPRQRERVMRALLG